MLWKGFQRPKRIEADLESLTSTYGVFSAQPFERGFGTTIGNALRRSLLSSIEGAAITALQIEGALHEFSSLSGIVEDVTDFILNLKQIPIRYDGEEPRIISVEVDGPQDVTAAAFDVDPQIEISFDAAQRADPHHRNMPVAAPHVSRWSRRRKSRATAKRTLSSRPMTSLQASASRAGISAICR